MQSASDASVSTSAMLSIVPLIRPLTVASRYGRGRRFAADDTLERFPMVVVERLHRSGQIVIGRGTDRPVQQPE